jgi:Zn-dependent protease
MDIRLLMLFVVLINVNITMPNMIPLPVLDGGYVVVRCQNFRHIAAYSFVHFARLAHINQLFRPQALGS